MKLNDFKIGESFVASAGFKWRCTDKGSRTITAIMLDPDKDESWFAGPPYSVDEVVFDELDMNSCFSNSNAIVLGRIEGFKKSEHPGFTIDDVSKMLKEKETKYRFKKLLKRERVGLDGSILHPYSAFKKDNNWYIKVFEIFSKEYSEIHENDFIKLPLSNNESLSKRSEKF